VNRFLTTTEKMLWDLRTASYLTGEPGPFVSVEDGRIVGEHRGLPFYTLGQGAKIRGALERYV